MMIGTKLDHPSKFARRLSDVTLLEQHHTEVVARGNVARIELQRPLVRDNCICRPARILQNVSQIAEIDRIARRSGNGAIKPPDRLGVPRFPISGKPGEMQGFGMAWMRREDLRADS